MTTSPLLGMKTKNNSNKYRVFNKFSVANKNPYFLVCKKTSQNKNLPTFFNSSNKKRTSSNHLRVPNLVPEIFNSQIDSLQSDNNPFHIKFKKKQYLPK